MASPHLVIICRVAVLSSISDRNHGPCSGGCSEPCAAGSNSGVYRISCAFDILHVVFAYRGLLFTAYPRLGAPSRRHRFSLSNRLWVTCSKKLGACGAGAHRDFNRWVFLQRCVAGVRRRSACGGHNAGHLVPPDRLGIHFKSALEASWEGIVLDLFMALAGRGRAALSERFNTASVAACWNFGVDFARLDFI